MALLLFPLGCSEFDLIGQKDGHGGRDTGAPDSLDTVADSASDSGEVGETDTARSPCDTASPPAMTIDVGAPEVDPYSGPAVCTEIGPVDWTMTERWSIPLATFVMNVVVAPNHGAPWASVFVDYGTDEVGELDGRDGSEIGRASTGTTWDDGSTPAVGDLDGDGDLDMVIQKMDQLAVYDSGDGSIRVFPFPWSRQDAGPDEVVQVLDVDNDGTPELVFPMGVMSVEGVVLQEFGDTLQSTGAFAMDLDGDGLPEVVNGAGIWRTRDGTGIAWPASVISPSFPTFFGGPVDLGGSAGVMFTAGLPSVQLARIDTTLEWDAVMGGDPQITAVGDVTGDDVPEMCITSSNRSLLLIDVTGTIVREWPRGEIEMLGGGCSMADLDGDGRYELLVSSYVGLFVLDGASGEILSSVPELGTSIANTSPVAADLDGDGSAELLVVTNDRLVALGPATGRWARTRPVWNQLAYDVTSVRDDGTLVSAPRPAWSVLNSFRAQPARDGAHPDLAVGIAGVTTADECEIDTTTLTGWIRNLGSVEAAPGATVRLLTGDSAGIRELATTTIPEPVAPGERLPVSITAARADLGTLWVVEVLPAHTDECDIGNDRAEGVP